MRIVDRGAGPPIVLVPGIQGRWEWMRPAVDALAAECRVVTFSLADERTCGAVFDEARGFECYLEQVRDAMDQAGVPRAVIGGVSYGGLIAAAFAARYPDRVAGLLLVSAIPPSWRPDARVRFYLGAPRALTPLFLLASLRLYREIAAAAPGMTAGARAALRHALNTATHPFSPAKMARRVRLIASIDLTPELRDLRTPTLVVTGEAGLDRVVPVPRTHEYLRLWPHAEQATIARTGHLGLITRPGVFAGVVAPFVRAHAESTGQAPGTSGRRRLG